MMLHLEIQNKYVKGGESILHVCTLILNALAMILAIMTKFWMLFQKNQRKAAGS